MVPYISVSHLYKDCIFSLGCKIGPCRNSSSLLIVIKGEISVVSKWMARTLFFYGVDSWPVSCTFPLKDVVWDGA